VNDTTILFYSSNREDRAFEMRIVEALLAVRGDHPIVSVTQQPFIVGERSDDLNIIVGNVGASGANLFMQVLIGLRAIKTRYVVSAEADSIYPAGYFDWTPPRDDVPYRATSLYIVPDHRDYFFHKREGSTVGQTVGTAFYRDTLEALFAGGPEWAPTEKNFPKERHGKVDIFDSFERWDPPAPLISFKTHRGLRFYTHSERTPILTLPYWGSGKALVRYFYRGEGNAPVATTLV
jgi:hypothetical protein